MIFIYYFEQSVSVVLWCCVQNNRLIHYLNDAKEKVVWEVLAINGFRTDQIDLDTWCFLHVQNLFLASGIFIV